MRIVGGKYRSRVLKEFSGDEIRPTADKVRESLFNILRDKIEGATFLDLFSGTGGVGIEAISRGAGKVTFVDMRKESLTLTKSNLKTLNETADTVLSDSIEFLKRAKDKFDIIFIDPPYKSDLGLKALNIISERKLLNERGIAIFESESPFSTSVAGLNLYDERKYGRVYLSFFKNKKPACVFAGTFDPVTKGHVDVINKAKKEFETVYVTVMVNPDKEPFFELKDRLLFLNELFCNDPQVKVEYHSGLAVDYLKQKDTVYYVRGYRNEADLSYEKCNEALSKALYPELYTIYYKAEKDSNGISSSAVREALNLGESYKELLPKKIIPLIEKALLSKQK